MKVRLLVVGLLLAVGKATNNEGKIWFEGDTVPGKNMTVRTSTPLPIGPYHMNTAPANGVNHQSMTPGSLLTDKWMMSNSGEGQQTQSSKEEWRPPKPTPAEWRPPQSSTTGWRPQQSSTTEWRPPHSTTTEWRPSETTSGDWSPSKVSKDLLALTLALDGSVRSKENKIFSPLSIASALAQLLLAARGVTRTELASLFTLASRHRLPHLPREKVDGLVRDVGAVLKEVDVGKAEGYHLSLANGLFVDRHYYVSPRFTSAAGSIFNSQTIQLDFILDGDSARRTINRWVYNRTGERIRELIGEPLSPDTKIVIANAVYFNGEWEYPFLFNATKIRKFHVSDTETVDVAMMVNTAEVYYHWYKDEANGHKVLGLPYKGRQLYMFIVLPDAGLANFTASLTPASLKDMVARTTLQQVIFTVPKMKLAKTTLLKDCLEELGVRSVFRSNVADLSGIGPGLSASQVYHKVELEVSETGTVAAGATSVSLNRDGSTPIVRVDHPFLFFIYHVPTETITFWGSVTRPVHHA